MSVVLHGTTRSWQRRSRATQLARWAAWLLGVAVCVACWRSISARTMWVFVTDAPWQALDLAARLVPPKWSYMSRLWRPLWDTLNMATLGTLLALAGIAVFRWDINARESTVLGLVGAGASACSSMPRLLTSPGPRCP